MRLRPGLLSTVVAGFGFRSSFDEFTREWLALLIDASLSGARRTRAQPPGDDGLRQQRRAAVPPLRWQEERGALG
jgi:hypothetical protein